MHVQFIKLPIMETIWRHNRYEDRSHLSPPSQTTEKFRNC